MQSACAALALLIFCHELGAQAAPARVAPNAAYAELLGNGGLFSINYERKFSRHASVRVGAAYWSSSDFIEPDAETRMVSIPLLLNWFGGSGSHYLEVGAGMLVGHKRKTFSGGVVHHSGGFASLTGAIGYRWERPLEPGQREGTILRAGFTPFFGFGDEEAAYPDTGFFPSIGLSFGLVF